MVLEDASGSPTATVSDDASPSSDADMYSSGSSQQFQRIFAIDYSQLPKPIPILGPLMGFSHERIERQTENTITELSKVIGRSLTSEESQAVAFHTAKGCSIASYGLPVGIAFGVWRERATRAQYSFIFFKPDLESGKFDPNKLGPLTGASAKLGWHSIRRLLYYGWFGYIGKALFGVQAAITAAVGERQDTRLKDAIETLMSRQRERMGESQARRPSRSQQQQSSAWGASDAGGQSAAPTSDYDAPAVYSPAASGNDQPVSPNAGAWGQQQPLQSPGYSNSTGYLDPRGSFDDDDASPTASLPPASGMGSGSTSAGSAWERLRRGGGGSAAPRPASNAAPGQRGNTNAGEQTREQTVSLRDSGSAQLDKERAQREFDARIDRERQGRDFDDSDAKWR